MIVAVISDIHGNLPALEAVVRDCRTEVDGFVCLGDVVNYGPWNDECLELIHSLPHLVYLEGNHESLFLGTHPVDDESPLVRQFFHASIKRFSRRDLITNLQPVARLGGFLFTHTIANLNIYKDTEFTPTEHCFVGHTHHAFDIVRAGKRVVNPGSVGQNRACLRDASYALFDTESLTVSLKRVDYPVEKLLAEMYSCDYPIECMNYYLSKL